MQVDDFMSSQDDGDPGDSGATGDSLASGFLSKIPESDRPYVEKYVKEWDAGVTRRFQSIRDEYRPFKDLGVSIEEIQSALGLANFVNTSPLDVYDILAENYADEIAARGKPAAQSGSLPEVPDDYEGMTPAAYQKFTQMEKLLNNVMGFLNDQQTQAEQAAEDKALEDTLKGLAAKHGEFDEDYVLGKIYAGLDPEKAVLAYKNMVQGVLNSRASRQAPAILGGAGAVPIQGRDVSKLNQSERRALVAQMLDQAQNQ